MIYKVWVVMQEIDNIFYNKVNHYNVLFEDAYDFMTILKGQYFIDVTSSCCKL